MEQYVLTMAGWQNWLLVLIAAYLFFILFRQSTRHTGEIKSILTVTAVVLLPLLLAAALIYDGEVFDAFDGDHQLNQSEENWWIVKYVPEEGDSQLYNIVGSALILSALYILTTAMVAVISFIYFRRKKTSLLAIHKAITKWGIVLIGTFICLKIEFWAILVGMGAASIVLGFALQKMLENLFTGIALETEGTFHKNDWISVGNGETVGQVYEKNWRATKIRTIDDESITIPNGLLGAEKILNFNKPGPLHARNLYVGTSYKDPPVKVKEVLKSVLLKSAGVERFPAPMVRTIEYGDFAINYEMKFWIRDYRQHTGIEDTIMTRVWYAFNFYDILIPFPIRTVHLNKKQELEEEQEGLETSFDSRVEFLRGLDYFKSLDSKDFDFLAWNCFCRKYAPGELVVRRGDVGDALYIVREGWCEVILGQDRRPRIDVGSYFGEMGLMGGRRRTADVRAGDEGAEVIRVDKFCMDVFFNVHTDLLDHFRGLRDERKKELTLHETMEEEKALPVPVRLYRYLRDLVKPW